ncbi:Uncharacterised protein [uncultured archaeon]|nr:Uncharacterised protein [uncultured archaeon]
MPVFSHSMTRSQPQKNYRKIRQLAKEVQTQKPPTIPFEGEEKLTHSTSDIISAVYGSNEENVHRARITGNPLLAFYSTMRYFGSIKNPDEGLKLLCEANEWLGRKRPQLPFASRSYLSLHLGLPLRIARLIDMCEAEIYMMQAAYEVMTKPEHAWYWTTLGKKVTDTINPEKRKEMYTVHAMLATAQKRSDEEQAWAEAIQLLQETGEPERVGESRNPVWRLKDSQFFSDTFMFKGSTNREALRTEMDEAQRYEKMLWQEIMNGEVRPLVPLHVTENEHNGYYVYAMRYAKGETLADKLAKKEFTELQRVTKLLAKIIARYPTEDLDLVDVEKKTEEKLYAPELNIPRDLANALLSHQAPVYAAIRQDPLIVLNRDGHPQQWQIGNSAITPLDLERKNKHWAAFEAANLFYYSDDLTPEQQKEGVRNFAAEIRKEGARQNRPELRQAYEDDRVLFRILYNAVIHRMICLTTAWSDPARPKMHSKRQGRIRQAINAITSLEKDDNEYYQKNRHDYEPMKQDLTKMLELIPS